MSILGSLKGVNPLFDPRLAGIALAPRSDCSGLRLSLSPTQAVPSTNQTAKTALYLVPYVNDVIELLDDHGNWVPRRIPYRPDNPLALDLAGIADATNYDVFIRWAGNPGYPQLQYQAWSSATARCSASDTPFWLTPDGLGMYQGRLVKGVQFATNYQLQPQWLYLGTIRGSAAGQCSDWAGNRGQRFVWNWYNRVHRSLYCVDTTSSRNYTTATFEAAFGNAANKVEMVFGVQSDTLLAMACCDVGSSTQVNVAAGIGIDSATVNSAQVTGGIINLFGHAYANYVGSPGLGYHYLQWLEISQAFGTTTWYGSANLAFKASGMVVHLKG